MTNVTQTFLSTYLFLFLTLYMLRAHRAHHQERQIVSILTLVTVTLCWLPCRVHTTRTFQSQMSIFSFCVGLLITNKIILFFPYTHITEINGNATRNAPII
jgi:hypothetical protein